MSEDLLQEWHAQAMSGDEIAMERLLLWVHYEATRYFASKAGQHEGLTRQDAEDLASQFVLEFQTIWMDVRLVARYTRHVLKKNLQRHLAAKSRLGHRADVSLLETRAHAVDQTHSSWMSWSDRGLQAYKAFNDEFFELPTVTKLLVEARIQQPPIPFSAMCADLGLDEGAARVRVSRFFGRVRSRCTDL